MTAQSKPKPERKPRAFTDLVSLLDHVFELDYFHLAEDGTTAIPHHWVRGRGNFAVCLGENASGKSFFRRIVTAIAHEAKVEAMPISMEGRGDSFGGLRGMVYGDESWQSTGENSSHTVLCGIRTCEERKTPHVIFWDEPDLGLSDDWAAGMGVALREFAENLPATTYGSLVVTHSRALVRELLPAEPHYLYFGSTEPPATLAEWVDAKPKARDLKALGEESHRRFKLIQKILDEVRR